MAELASCLSVSTDGSSRISPSLSVTHVRACFTVVGFFSPRLYLPLLVRGKDTLTRSYTLEMPLSTSLLGWT